jgi:hypothetical protein
MCAQYFHHIHASIQDHVGHQSLSYKLPHAYKTAEQSASGEILTPGIYNHESVVYW